MDISALTSIQNDYLNSLTQSSARTETKRNSFDSILESAMKMISETNELQQKANYEEIRFALGESENMHDLITAQSKALTAIQYITAVKNKALEAYKEIMNMQI